MIRKLLTILNKLLPKFNHVIVQGFPTGESSAVEVANYLNSNYNLPVYFAISKINSKLKDFVLLNKGIHLISEESLYFRWKYFTAKYIYFTHGSPLSSFSKRQTVINIWHGVLYKNVGKLNYKPGIPASLTVATSDLTSKMFAEAFGVSESKIVISGYPRNDILLRSKVEKNNIKRNIGENFENFDKIIIWLPTYRKSIFGDIRTDGIEVDNPFYIDKFDVDKFNNLLKGLNVLCVVKPHPMAPKFESNNDLDNILFIDDQWITNKGLTLYHLVGSTDLLISDVSSIIIDYLLIDKPIICVSTDFEEYKNSRGFYFDDIENWIPTKILKTQNELFNLLEQILISDIDPYEDKRQSLKNKFFTYHDPNSTERLIKHIMKT